MKTLRPGVCDYLKIRIVDKLNGEGVCSGISNIVLVLHSKRQTRYREKKIMIVIIYDVNGISWSNQKKLKITSSCNSISTLYFYQGNEKKKNNLNSKLNYPIQIKGYNLSYKYSTSYCHHRP